MTLKVRTSFILRHQNGYTQLYAGDELPDFVSPELVSYYQKLGYVETEKEIMVEIPIETIPTVESVETVETQVEPIEAESSEVSEPVKPKRSHKSQVGGED